ncbi:PAS domain S-box-containing protein [Streptomyces sp. DvalAA-14]|uniref:SpoIIE family protein phosphatase n=1 Tax=unclassified Streptomyces TaxID=2593676 RepID=UPI00081B32FA|nr:MULTISPECIES: SpoIIE family protein phosphatase [unclassified Streptomyces]MYS24173.1 SpoIIE family protein phosphatase [Streptomyces sp. SID4948]SCE43372.1 PAS domain S-box-containing protein [Streptomyces sp. DvalAA-14]
MAPRNRPDPGPYDPRAARSTPGRETATPRIGPEERLALNGVGSFDWDLERGVFELDPAGLDVFDLDPEEFDRRPETLALRVTPQERARLDKELREALQEGWRSYGGYFQVVRHDGAMQWTHTQGTVLRDERGNAYRIVGIVRDATEELEEAPAAGEPAAGLEQLHVPSIVRRTTEALSEAVTVEDVTAVLTGEGALERFGADGLALGLVEGGTLRYVAVCGEALTGLGLEDLPPRRLDTALPLDEAVLTQRPRYATGLADLGERFPPLGPSPDRLGMESAAFLPLIAQARSIGGLALFYRGRRAFSREDRELDGALAGILAQSLQRAVLFDQEREFATGLQESMLPRHIPRFGSVEIAVRYHAARRGREVGGDWYDVVGLPQNRVGLVVGDVQGHDTHAAAVMGQLRIALRAYAAEGHPPSTVLARASRFLAELDTERFATCGYAELDLDTGTVRVARAGHLGPLIRRTDGRTGWPHVRGGLPLGLATQLGTQDFPETRLDLVPGETLAFCTDGLVEERGVDIGVGMAALAEAVHHGPQPVEELADYIADHLWERWGSDDDVALLLLRRTPDRGTAGAPRFHQYVHQADPQGLAEARGALRRALAEWGLSEIADDVELAAGELLVNVLLHTEGGAVLTLEVLPEPVRRVRLSVQDRSSQWPRRRSPGEAATSGRGLLMIDAMASSWGVEPRGDGKAVWCEFGPAADGPSAGPA